MRVRLEAFALLAAWLLPFIWATASPESMSQRRDTPLPVALPPATTRQTTALAAALRMSPLLMSLYALMTFALGYLWHALWCRRADARRRGWTRLSERELDLLPTTADPAHDGAVPPPRVPRGSLQLPDRARGRWRPQLEQPTRRSQSVSSLRPIVRPVSPTARRHPGTSRLSDDRPLIDLLPALADDRPRSTPPHKHDFATNAHVWGTASSESLPLSDDAGVFGPREWRHPVLPRPAHTSASSLSSRSDGSSGPLLRDEEAKAAPQPATEEHALIDWSDSLSPPPSPSLALRDLIRFDEEREKQSIKDGESPPRPAPPPKRNAVDDVVRLPSTYRTPLQVDEPRSQAEELPPVVVADALPSQTDDVPTAAGEIQATADDSTSAMRRIAEEHGIPQCESPASIQEPLPLWTATRPTPAPISVPVSWASRPDDQALAPDADDGDACSVDFEVVTPTESNFSVASSPELHRPSLPAEPVLTPVGEERHSYLAHEQEDTEDPADAVEQADTMTSGSSDEAYETDTDGSSFTSEQDADVSSADEDDEPEMPAHSAPIEAALLADDDVPPFSLESPATVYEDLEDEDEMELGGVMEAKSPAPIASRTLSIDVAVARQQSLGSALPSPSEERRRMAHDAAERTPTASKAQSPMELALTPPATAVPPLNVAASPIEVVLDAAPSPEGEKPPAACQPMPAQTPTPPSSPPMPASAVTKKRPAWSVRALEAPQLSYTRTRSGDAAKSESSSETPRKAAGETSKQSDPSASRAASPAVETSPEGAQKQESDEGKEDTSRAPTPRLSAPVAIVRQSSVPGGFPGTGIDDEYDDPPLQELPRSPSEQPASPWKFRFPSRPEPLTLDVALTMQLRPGIGVNSDPAWMVRFLMAAFGWLGVLAAGGEGF
ncbi:hypothetical protein HDZ31DRAFT_43569 [Schizophyllum fasciatum]